MMFTKKEEPAIAYTIEICPSCKKELKRKFVEGDCLFVASSECSTCKIPMNIAKIFGEAIE